jgi:transcriptional regulator with XRE-family HTH domain
MVELLESIGHNIRRLRDAKGWNQTELGFHADTSPSIISLIENGKRNPSTATLAKIAGALGVEVVDLFPKGGRSSPELSFEELMEAELRGGATDADLLKEYEAVTRNYRLAFRKAIEGLVAPWQERLRTGAFNRSMVEQFFSDCYALSEGIALALSTVTVENLLQVKYKPPTSEDLEEMWASSIAPAAVSLMELSADLWDAAVARFPQDELAEVQRIRDEMRRALEHAA